MKKSLGVFVLAMICLGIVATPRDAKAVDVTLVLKNIRPSGFIEWKVESDQVSEQATGHLAGAYPPDKTWTWNMGDSNQNIWFWWDTLDGEVDATVLVDGIVVFDGHCKNTGNGEVRMDFTSEHPITFKTSGPGPFLRLLDPSNKPDTHIFFH
jgi:hypothetical protein